MDVPHHWTWPYQLRPERLPAMKDQQRFKSYLKVGADSGYKEKYWDWFIMLGNLSNYERKYGDLRIQNPLNALQKYLLKGILNIFRRAEKERGVTSLSQRFS